MPPCWSMHLLRGLSNSSFRAELFWQIFGEGWTNWFNWFLLSQTFNKKGKLLLRNSSLSYKNFLFLWFDNGSLNERHKEAAMCVKWGLQKFNAKIMKTVTCLGFLKIEEFYRSWTLAATGGFLMSSLYVVPIKIFVWPSQIFYVFCSICQHHEKVV